VISHFSPQEISHRSRSFFRRFKVTLSKVMSNSLAGSGGVVSDVNSLSWTCCGVKGRMRRNWLPRLCRFSRNGSIWTSSRTAVAGSSR